MIRLGLLLALVGAPSFASQLVYECKDGQRYLKVFLQENGKLTGTLKEFKSGGYGVRQFRCERTSRAVSYECKSGDYIVRAFKGASGRRTVSVELAGDFGPSDSGYLYSLSCE